MKRWLVPAVALGIAIFLVTEPGRRTQDRFSSNIGDWVERIIKINDKVQEKLQQAQSALEHFNRALHEAQR